MKNILTAIILFAVNFSYAQLYERGKRNMGLQAGYDYTATHTSKKGFLPGEIGAAFRIGYMRSLGDLIYPGIIFNYRINNIVYNTDTAGNNHTTEVKTPSIQIPVLIQLPLGSVPLGKSKKAECTYINTNFRIGPEFSYNFKTKSDFNFNSHHEWAMQAAFGFNVSKSGGTHRQMAWDVQWHLVWRKSFSHLGSLDGFTGSTKYYNNYVGVTLTIIRYATTSFLP